MTQEEVDKLQDIANQTILKKKKKKNFTQKWYIYGIWKPQMFKD